MAPRLALALLPVFALSACTSPPTTPLPAAAAANSHPATVADNLPALPRLRAAAPHSAAPVDDLALLRRLQAEAERHAAAPDAVKLAALVKQLGRRSCRVSLPDLPRRPAAPAAFYEQLRPAVLVFGSLYKCDKCTRWHLSLSAGFALTEDGVCVTNYHVVNQPTHEVLVALTADQRVLPVLEVLAASPEHDLAILRLRGAGLTPLPLGDPAPVGAHVRLISHPDHRFYMLTEGVVSRYFLLPRTRSPVPAMAITADFAKGSSGAPVLNDRGEVVGLVASTTSVYYTQDKDHQENLQMVLKQCVPVASLRALLDGKLAGATGF